MSDVEDILTRLLEQDSGKPGLDDIDWGEGPQPAPPDDVPDGETPEGYHRHPNGGGLVQDTATVDDSAYVGFNAWISGNAQVLGNVRVSGDTLVTDNAVVGDDARVSGDAVVSENARISGNAYVSGDAIVTGNAVVTGNAGVFGGAIVSGDAVISGTAQVDYDVDTGHIEEAAEEQLSAEEQDKEVEQMLQRFEENPICLWLYTDLPIRERMALAYLAADEMMGAPFDEDQVRQFMEAIRMVIRKEEDLWKQIAEKAPVRAKRWEELEWSLELVQLDRVGVWPRFGGFPEEWCRGSVLDTARELAASLQSDGKRSRVLELATKWLTAVKFLPPVLVPGGMLRGADADYEEMDWDIDDGNHRLVGAAIGGAKEVVCFVGREPSKEMEALIDELFEQDEPGIDDIDWGEPEPAPDGAPGDVPEGWHRHANGGGLVQDTATVADTAHVGPDAKVYGTAWVYGFAHVCGFAQVYGNARVYDDAWVYGNALVSGNAHVSGNAEVDYDVDTGHITEGAV